MVKQCQATAHRLKSLCIQRDGSSVAVLEIMQGVNAALTSWRRHIGGPLLRPRLDEICVHCLRLDLPRRITRGGFRRHGHPQVAIVQISPIAPTAQINAAREDRFLLPGKFLLAGLVANNLLDTAQIKGVTLVSVAALCYRSRQRPSGTIPVGDNHAFFATSFFSRQTDTDNVSVCVDVLCETTVSSVYLTPYLQQSRTFTYQDQKTRFRFFN